MRNTNDHDGSSRGGSAATYSGLTRSSGRFELWPYLVSLIAVAGATVVAWLLQPIAGLENVDLVFLTAIIAIAVRYGLRPSLIGSVASLLAYNFFSYRRSTRLRLPNRRIWQLCSSSYS